MQLCYWYSKIILFVRCIQVIILWNLGLLIHVCFESAHHVSVLPDRCEYVVWALREAYQSLHTVTRGSAFYSTYNCLKPIRYVMRNLYRLSGNFPSIWRNMRRKCIGEASTEAMKSCVVCLAMKYRVKRLHKKQRPRAPTGSALGSSLLPSVSYRRS